MKLALLLLVWAMLSVATGCSSNNPVGANANVARSEKEVEKEDGSIVTVSTSSNGTKAEARAFPSGDIARVTRITSPNGRRRALVEFRDARSAEIKDENEVDRVIEASADTVRAAAIKAWEAKQAAGSEVQEKANEVTNRAADAGKGAGQTVNGAVRRGAEEVEDAASAAAEAAKKGGKRAGKSVKKVGEKIKNSIKP